MKKTDAAGKKFGLLIALHHSRSVPKRAYWMFKCECGSVKEIGLDHVVSGKIRSCGCFQVQSIKDRTTIHGHSINGVNSPEIRSYFHAKNRCTNKNDKKYHLYGGRGISMCKRWMDSPALFLDDMGKRPTTKHSLDRIDVNANYEPSNCRWATDHEQRMNRRTTIYTTYKNNKMTLLDCAKLANVSYKSLWYQVRIKCLHIEDAIYFASKAKNRND